MNTALSACVTSLKQSTEILQSTIDILDTSIKDYPRLTKVLSSRRHFELISAKEIAHAQSKLSSTINPEIERLLKEAEKVTHKLELKETKLIADSKLLEIRIDNSQKGGLGNKSKVGGIKVVQPSIGGEENQAVKEEKLKKLKAQKQRLAYAVERLELEKRQKEMAVRKSMSYGVSG